MRFCFSLEAAFEDSCLCKTVHSVQEQSYREVEFMKLYWLFMSVL